MKYYLYCFGFFGIVPFLPCYLGLFLMFLRFLKIISDLSVFLLSISYLAVETSPLFPNLNQDIFIL